jgi:Carboxypeptidase regulatory-like domain
MPRSFRLAFALLLLAATAGAAAAQETGTVRGQALGEDGGALSYALVSLRPEGGGAARSTVTREDGVFRFAGVAPGAYRLRLERIGFQEVWSETLAVGAGATVEWTFRGAPRPIAIEGVSSVAACHTGDQLARDPELAALWGEARKGMETRRAFDAETRYRFLQLQLTRVQPVRGRPVQIDTLVRVVSNDPALPLPDPARRRGYGSQRGRVMNLDIPDGKEILDPAFLRTHCLEGGFEAADSAWEVGFRPVRARRGRVDVRGTVRIDRRTFQIQSLRLDYLDGGRPFMETTIYYGDVELPGGSLRLPVSAFFNGGAIGRLRRVLEHVSGHIVFTNYSDFAPASTSTSAAPSPPPPPARS